MRLTDVVRQPGMYDADAVSIQTGLECRDPSLAVQSEAEDADINTIVRRFGLIGAMPTAPRVPTYGDFEGVESFQDAMLRVRAAEEAFMELPAELRKRFGNDPAVYHDFCTEVDENEKGEIVLKNLAEMRKLGLAVEKEVTDDTPAPGVPAKE